VSVKRQLIIVFISLPRVPKNGKTALLSKIKKYPLVPPMLLLFLYTRLFERNKLNVVNKATEDGNVSIYAIALSFILWLVRLIMLT